MTVRLVNKVWPAESRLDGEWPRISIVTPSFNQAKYLDACINSVLSQGYPNLEYIVMDGGSTDGSVEIIKKYSKYIDFWQSCPDGGHYPAVNAGMQRTTGEILGWLNSDDMFHPNGLFVVGNVFRKLPIIRWLTGRRIGFTSSGERLSFGYQEQRWARRLFLDPETLSQELFLMQEGTFWRRTLWDEAGGSLDSCYKFAADFDLWLRFSRLASLHTVEGDTGGFRLHEDAQRSKEHKVDYFRECFQIIQRERQIISNDPSRDEYFPPLIVSPLYNPHPLPKSIRAPTIISELKTAKTQDPRYPKISMVTSVLNQVTFVEECLDSVLSQGWPNLEYIVMDGGSTDGTGQVLNKYKHHFSYYQSQPDGGQYFAINEGFKRSTGQIMGWLNADDKLHPNAFDSIASIFQKFPACEWISGRPNGFNAAGEQDWILIFLPHYSRKAFLELRYRDPFIQQESVFWKRSLWEKAGGYIDTSWEFAADLELWTRFFRHAPLHVVNLLLGGFRKVPNQRSEVNFFRYIRESNQILEKERRLFMQGTYPNLIPNPAPIISF